MEVSVQSLEVTVGESGIEPGQPRTVFELALRNRYADGDRHPLVQRREISQSTRCLDRPFDHGPECIDDLRGRASGGDRWRRWRCHWHDDIVPSRMSFRGQLTELVSEQF